MSSCDCIYHCLAIRGSKPLFAAYSSKNLRLFSGSSQDAITVIIRGKRKIK